MSGGSAFNMLAYASSHVQNHDTRMIRYQGGSMTRQAQPSVTSNRNWHFGRQAKDDGGF